MKSLLLFFISGIAILFLAGGTFALDFFKRNDLVVPRTILGDIDLSGMSREEVRNAMRARLKQFRETPFHVGAGGEAKQLTLNDLGIFFNESEIFDSIPYASGITNAELMLWSFAGQRIIPSITVSRTEVVRLIAEKFPSIPKMRNAYVASISASNHFIFEEAKKGLLPDVEPVLRQIQQNIMFLESQPILVEFTESIPTVTAVDLKEYSSLLKEKFPRAISLVFEKDTWEVNFEKHPEWIYFERKPYKATPGELPVSLEWDEVAFSNFLNEKIAPKLEQAPEGIRIWRDESQKIQFEGHGIDGRSIEREKLLEIINQAINKQEGAKIEIPLAVVLAKVEVSSNLQELGIKELLANGYTRFEGSPSNRIHNIGVGVARFNGMLIPSGETFSFGKNLGPVDGSTGYRKELVIKPEGTIPEFGGGLCQVSSTMYRAAIIAGLPIIERKPHSYAVRYYAQVGGHGLDATVYPPAVDLKFTNDTPGHIVIHSYVDGVTAYFKFYGTSDGRNVSLDGPYISNRRGAPAQALLIPDKKLKAGEKKQVEKPHDGFDALWYRRITKDGKMQEEKIVSRYKAVPAKFLVGGEVEPSAQPPAPATNPFE